MGESYLTELIHARPYTWKDDVKRLFALLEELGEPRFTSAEQLIGDLSRAAAEARLEEALEPFIHPHVLVIDELGYQSYAPDAANVLYRAVNDRHLNARPMIVTTNKPLAALGQLLLDGDLAEPILDRLLERGTHFVLRGRSYRTRHLKEEAGGKKNVA